MIKCVPFFRCNGLPVFRCEFFGYTVNNRANLAVLVGQVQYLHKAFAVGMRVFAAGFGALFVHCTIVVGQ